MTQKTFQEAVDQARKIIKRFEKIEGKPWKVEGSMIELQKQLGQLSALVMMQEQYYPLDRDKDNPQYQTSKAKIGDELADILFMIIRIADLYEIDLEKAHYDALEEAGNYLKSKGNEY